MASKVTLRPASVVANSYPYPKATAHILRRMGARFEGVGLGMQGELAFTETSEAARTLNRHLSKSCVQWALTVQLAHTKAPFLSSGLIPSWCSLASLDPAGASLR